VEQCPWDGIRDAYGAPNVNWCEAELCSWVTEPANTWSNLAYIGVALFLFTRRKAMKNASFPEVSWFAPVVFALGWMSFVYHASTTFLLQVLDFFGMFLLLGLPVVINLRRLGWVKSGWHAYLIWNVVMLALLFALRAVGLKYQGMIFFGIVAVLLSESLLRLRPKPTLFVTPSLELLGFAVACLTVAVVFSMLDVTRIWCVPDNHVLQGHAIWHLGSAASQIFVQAYYASFVAKNLAVT